MLRMLSFHYIFTQQRVVYCCINVQNLTYFAFLEQYLLTFGLMDQALNEYYLCIITVISTYDIAMENMVANCQLFGAGQAVCSMKTAACCILNTELK